MGRPPSKRDEEEKKRQAAERQRRARERRREGVPAGKPPDQSPASAKTPAVRRAQLRLLTGSLPPPPPEDRAPPLTPEVIEHKNAVEHAFARLMTDPLLFSMKHLTAMGRWCLDTVATSEDASQISRAVVLHELVRHQAKIVELAGREGRLQDAMEKSILPVMERCGQLMRKRAQQYIKNPDELLRFEEDLAIDLSHAVQQMEQAAEAGMKRR